MIKLWSCLATLVLTKATKINFTEKIRITREDLKVVIFKKRKSTGWILGPLTDIPTHNGKFKCEYFNHLIDI